MPYQLPQQTAHLERTGCQAEIAVAKRRGRLLKPFSELHKLTLSSIPWLRRTGPSIAGESWMSLSKSFLRADAFGQVSSTGKHEWDRSRPFECRLRRLFLSRNQYPCRANGLAKRTL
jgi:hypothetical protein